MVPDPGTPAGAHALRPLNQPAPAAVEEDRWGDPAAVFIRGTARRVQQIVDRWRIDDEWWRNEISRQYFVVELEGGKRLTLYHDLVTKQWFSQGYYGPWAQRIR